MCDDFNVCKITVFMSTDSICISLREIVHWKLIVRNCDFLVTLYLLIAKVITYVDVLVGLYVGSIKRNVMRYASVWLPNLQALICSRYKNMLLFIQLVA